jgi:hypothetical protein
VFERELLVAARGAIRSIDSSESFIDEACQRLLVGDRVRARIADDAGHGPLRAWVGVAAVRTALRPYGPTALMRRSTCSHTRRDLDRGGVGMGAYAHAHADRPTARQDLGSQIAPRRRRAQDSQRYAYRPPPTLGIGSHGRSSQAPPRAPLITPQSSG